MISMASMNPTTMNNLNRMTFLMAISEITPQLFISGWFVPYFDFISISISQVKWLLLLNKFKNWASLISTIVYPKHIKLEKFDIIDFPTAQISTYFNALTDKIHAHLIANKQNKVLVHCMAGISRSNNSILLISFSMIIIYFLFFRYNNCLCLFNALYEYEFTWCVFIM